MRYLVTLFAVAAFSSPAFSDDWRPNIDEQSGSWVAASFLDGTVTKICAASSSDRKIVLRADETDLEFRTSNDDWSLSADATGM